MLDAPQRALAAALVPPTKGVAEAFGADVVHLPTRKGLTTTIPTLYHPWDLQHVRYPEFFEDGERRDRDAIYRALCRQAAWSSPHTVGREDCEPPGAAPGRWPSFPPRRRSRSTASRTRTTWPGSGRPTSSPSVCALPGADVAALEPPRARGWEPADLAAKLRRVWEDDGLRHDLAARGRERSREFSWERTAPICRAHYRQVAGVRLAEDDHTLVQEART